MKKEHIAEIVSIDSFDILGEINGLETIPIGTLLETRKYVKIIFVVLDDLFQTAIPNVLPQSYGIDEDRLDKEFPHRADYLRYLIKLYPIAEYDDEAFNLPMRSPLMNALLYELELEKEHLLFEKFDIMSALFSIDVKKFPRRNKAIINLIKTYLSYFDSTQTQKLLEGIFDKISIASYSDINSISEIVKGIRHGSI